MGILIFAIIVSLFFWLTFKNMSYAVTVFICMFAAEQWGTIYLPFIAQNGTLFNALILCLLAVSWFRIPAGATIEIIQYPIRLLLISLLFYTLVSTIWSPFEASATQRLSDASYYLVAALLIAPLLLRKPEDFTRMLDAVNWLGGAIVIAFAYIPSFDGRSVAASDAVFTEDALSLPLALSTFSGVVAIVSVIRVKKSPIHILWAVFVFGSAVYLQVKTGSRGQFAFTLAAIMFCLPTLWKGFSVNRVFLYCLAALLIAATIFVVVNTENTLSARLGADSVDGAVGNRFEFAIVMLDLWSTDFTTIIFGLGSSASWAVIDIYIHNVTLEVLAELGLIGFLLLSLAVTWIIQLGYSGKVRRQLSIDSARDFAALFGCWLLAYLTSFKQGAMIGSVDLFFYAALLEKCVIIGQLSFLEKGKKRKRRKRR